MKNYGDICLIDGTLVEPVDCIIGGSPCQDLSTAGNKSGLNGSKSSLFLEQMRIVREMRVATKYKQPKFMIWENVVGALSCSGGRDFRCVLSECVKAAMLGKENESRDKDKADKEQEQVPSVPLPENGRWPEEGILWDDLGSWSIAYRTHDAYDYGSPQHRKRIALVIDFGGLRASEVLFEQ